MALVEIRDVHKSFQRDTQRIDIFAGITLDVEEGSVLALAARGLRLPAVQPAAGAHGVPERRAAAAAHEALEEGARRAREARALGGRARRPHGALPAAALGRAGA